MAIMKEYQYGTKKGNYWKIIGVYPDSAYTNTNIKVALYENQGARIKDESSYVSASMFNLSGMLHDKAKIYGKLKELPQFNNCKDI